jgi:peroxiredoxin Q/BCP
VVGVSPDNEASHRDFIDKTAIPFPLLCDPDKNVMTRYEAYGEKKLYGKVTRGVIRSTVWIGPDGRIVRHWRKVAKAGEHPAKVLEAIKQARAKS